MSSSSTRSSTLSAAESSVEKTHAPTSSRLEWLSSQCLVNNDSVLTVPYSGFYSVAFGYVNPILCESLPGRKRKRQQQSRNTVHSDTSPNTSENVARVDTILAHLEIRQLTQSSGSPDSTTITRLELPWREPDSNNPQILNPPSLHLGKVMWIEEEAQLRVCMPKQEASNQISINKNKDNDRQSDATETLQWQVRLQSVPRQKPDDAATPRKAWACILCGRAFHSALSVSQHQEQSHFEDVHRTNSSAAAASSIWTTPLSVVYKDEYLAVVIKPQGMAVMGDFEGKTLQRSSLLMALIEPGQTSKDKVAWPSKVTESSDVEQSYINFSEKDIGNKADVLDSYLGKPRPVHRLDGPTGGLLVVAKTRRTEKELKQSFEDRACHKTYRALVYGKITTKEGECSQPLSGKPSLTHYRVLRHSRSGTSSDGWLTTVELYPHTGRMHQLRKHMQMMGHPMWGDKRYGPKQNDDQVNSSWQSRLCLWALAIRFPHPATGEEVSCSMPDPDWLEQVVQHEENEWKKLRTSSET